MTQPLWRLLTRPTVSPATRGGVRGRYIKRCYRYKAIRAPIRDGVIVSAGSHHNTLHQGGFESYFWAKKKKRKKKCWDKREDV